MLSVFAQHAGTGTRQSGSVCASGKKTHVTGLSKRALIFGRCDAQHKGNILCITNTSYASPSYFNENSEGRAGASAMTCFKEAHRNSFNAGKNQMLYFHGERG